MPRNGPRSPDALVSDPVGLGAFRKAVFFVVVDVLRVQFASLWPFPGVGFVCWGIGRFVETRKCFSSEPTGVAPVASPQASRLYVSELPFRLRPHSGLLLAR